jgi:hypothetical protein
MYYHIWQDDDLQEQANAGSAQCCVIGQLAAKDMEQFFGDVRNDRAYGDGMARLCIALDLDADEFPALHGFETSDNEEDCYSYSSLQEAWIQLIANRKRALAKE